MTIIRFSDVANNRSSPVVARRCPNTSHKTEAQTTLALADQSSLYFKSDSKNITMMYRNYVFINEAPKIFPTTNKPPTASLEPEVRCFPLGGLSAAAQWPGDLALPGGDRRES